MTVEEKVEALRTIVEQWRDPERNPSGLSLTTFVEREKYDLPGVSKSVARGLIRRWWDMYKKAESDEKRQELIDMLNDSAKANAVLNFRASKSKTKTEEVVSEVKENVTEGDTGQDNVEEEPIPKRILEKDFKTTEADMMRAMRETSQRERRKARRRIEAKVVEKEEAVTTKPKEETRQPSAFDVFKKVNWTRLLVIAGIGLAVFFLLKYMKPRVEVVEKPVYVPVSSEPESKEEEKPATAEDLLRRYHFSRRR